MSLAIAPAIVMLPEALASHTTTLPVAPIAPIALVARNALISSIDIAPEVYP